MRIDSTHRFAPRSTAFGLLLGASLALSSCGPAGPAGGEAPTASRTHAATSIAGKIAFESWQATNTASASRSQIGVMNGDGSGQINISNNLFNDFNPAWNRVGSKLVFASERPSSGGSSSTVVDIYTMNSDGSAQTRITNNAGLRPQLDMDGPQLSPDGSKIVFEGIPLGVANATWEIYIVNADGTNLTQLTSNPTGGGDMGPTFTPDGTRILFERANPSVGPGGFLVDMVTMRLDGTGQTVLTTVQGDYIRPSYSPDGQRIAFGQDFGSTSDIAVMNADGTGQTVVLSGQFSNYPSFGPDSTAIAFDSVPVPTSASSTDEVYAMNAGGTGVAQLTFGPGVSPPSSIESNGVPSWAPGTVGLPTLTALTLNPASVYPGNPSVGTVVLNLPAPAGGSAVLLGGNAAAAVPASVTVSAGATSASFSIGTLNGTGLTSATVTATYDGVSQSATLAFNPPDTVAITKAEYTISQKLLKLNATSTNLNATLTAYLTATGAFMGTLTNVGGGKYQLQITWPTTPLNITVNSNQGGSATGAVTIRN